MADPTTSKGRDTKRTASGNVVTNKLFVDECRKRLDDVIKSMNENFSKMISLGRMGDKEDSAQGEGEEGQEEDSNDCSGEMADFQTIHTEMCSRITLMTKASDELTKLTNDIREFLILRDFNYMNQSTLDAEKKEKEDSEARAAEYIEIRARLTEGIAEIDKEIMESFGMRK